MHTLTKPLSVEKKSKGGSTINPTKIELILLYSEELLDLSQNSFKKSDWHVLTIWSTMAEVQMLVI